PDKVEYVRQVIDALYQARAIVASYNIVLLSVILILAVLHWRQRRRDKHKWLRLREPPENSTDGICCPSDAVEDIDVERAPLLAGRPTQNFKGNMKNVLGRRISSWLIRQPPPLPIVNRTLPSNATSLFVLAWVALNVFIHFFRLPLRWDFFFIFADRAGFVFIVNLPLLYLLSAKNQPLRKLTGYSYEALNLFHRRVGELMCFEAAVHFIGMLVWQFVLAEDWLLATHSPKAYFTHPLILFGVGTLTCYEVLFFTSLASFRQRWYELFLATHVLLQVSALVFLWFHYETSHPYVVFSLIIFLADRFIWRLLLKRANLIATIHLLDKETYLLSADWPIPSDGTPPEQSKSSRLLPLGYKSILHGWDPTDHVFLTVPALGPSYALQAHPFTIASAAPGRPQHHRLLNSSSSAPASNKDDSVQIHASLTLLIRAHRGFTSDLLRYAQQQQEKQQDQSQPGPLRLSVQLDGPYGSPHALDMLRASSCAVLVAGGSGIAVVLPLVWALLHDHGHHADGGGDHDDNTNSSVRACSSSRTQTPMTRRTPARVCLLWVTHTREHRAWVPGGQLDELAASPGVDLVIPEPTAEAGRPDVAGTVKRWIENAAAAGDDGFDGGEREVGVLVSGPDGLNRTVRNVCADAVGRGRPVRVAVEKFGW
ncbi:hypothetical protein N656DRAFT_697309, partial [Canariomyces notabilis]